MHLWMPDIHIFLAVHVFKTNFVKCIVYLCALKNIFLIDNQSEQNLYPPNVSAPTGCFALPTINRYKRSVSRAPRLNLTCKKCVCYFPRISLDIHIPKLALLVFRTRQGTFNNNISEESE